MNYKSIIFIPVILLGIALIILLQPFQGVEKGIHPEESLTERVISHKLELENRGLKNLRFDLVDPEQAPPPIREMVELGYHLMLDTPRYASAYVGDRLSCTNCHFAGGNTTSGEGGGIALAGVAAKYPKYDSRMEAVIDLPTRINGCFERSMNGRPLPLDSREMLALTTYFHWISRDMPIYQKVPWLGLKSLKKTDQIPDPEKGKQVYDIQCAICHGKEGQGEVRKEIPPIWGPHAYNSRAGMQNEEALASFIYHNMPYQEPRALTVEQAKDVAAFLVRQPRPQ